MKKIVLFVFLCLSISVMADKQQIVVSSYLTETEQKSPLSFTAGDVTVTAVVGSGQTKPQYSATTGYFGVYANGQLTISVAGTDTIKAIAFVGVDASQLASLTPSTGTMSQGVDIEPSWSGEAQSVTFTVSAKADCGKSTSKAGQLKFQSITITFNGEVTPASDEFVKGVDLYYGTEYSTNYNHQLWLLTEGLEYEVDPSTGTGSIVGEDGMTMRLDLFNSNPNDISGSYTITDPNASDKPGCINKKYTYWTYFEEGSFIEQKLTIGTCTISCSGPTTYDIDYDVQEIDNGTKHSGSLKNIPVSAITSSGATYTLINNCDTPQAIGETEYRQDIRKFIQNGQLVIERNGKQYDIVGKIL